MDFLEMEILNINLDLKILIGAYMFFFFFHFCGANCWTGNLKFGKKIKMKIRIEK